MAGKGDADPKLIEAENREKREEKLELAKVAHEAENFDHVIEYMTDVVKLGTQLGIKHGKEERSVLSNAFKRHINQKRGSIAKVKSCKQNLTKHEQTYATRLGNELRDTCKKLFDLLDLLIPNVNHNEDKAFYLKMKGDFSRYILELNPNDKDLVEECDKTFQEAQKICDTYVTDTSTTYLGVYLNFAIFINEFKKDEKRAVEMAKKATENIEEKLRKLAKDDEKRESELLAQSLINFINSHPI